MPKFGTNEQEKNRKGAYKKLRVGGHASPRPHLLHRIGESGVFLGCFSQGQ